MPGVTVIDYGRGNLLSVARAFEYCGAEVLMTSDPEKVAKAERLVLPGVGAFADGMAALRDLGLVEPIRTFAATGRPFLGICLGMQMMLDRSDEFGSHAGLGLIPGHVVAIPATRADGLPHKIPHIGWNRLQKPLPGTGWEDTILAGLCPGVDVYFVHSFTAVPQCAENSLADCDYHGRPISAVIQSGSLYGCQFHPEKSGPAGLRILQSFLHIA
jgi:glutamine amidotransferase